MIYIMMHNLHEVHQHTPSIIELIAVCEGMENLKFSKKRTLVENMISQKLSRYALY